MKNRGFTLIELLATITILSIILLIAFVSVSSIITNSKDSLHNSQIKQIEKAAEYYNNKEGLNDTDICVNVSYLTKNGYIKENDITDPKDGKKLNGSVLISYDNKKYSYSYSNEKCKNIFEIVGDFSDDQLKDEEFRLAEGRKYEVEVKKNTKFNFYVLSKNDDDTVNLIMDRNICEDGTTNYSEDVNQEGDIEYCRYKWGIKSRIIPNTAMTNLYNATKDWENIPDMDLSEEKAYYDEGHLSNNSYGYTKLETTADRIIITHKDGITVTEIEYDQGKPLKARMPMLSELTNLNCEKNKKNACPQWLLENIDPMTTSGYWLMTSSTNELASVVNSAKLIDWILYYPDYGIRPVITVPSTMLLQ